MSNLNFNFNPFVSRFMKKCTGAKLNKQLYYTRGLNECLTRGINALAAVPLAR